MKILLLGADGQVGFELAGALAGFAEVIESTVADLDLEDLAAVRERVRLVRPDVVVNATAYTDVDGAEKEEARARAINADAVAVLGEACRELRAALVHYSTDFVFDGRAGRAYVEDDATNPLGAYGRTKREGELRLVEMGAPALVLRTAWVYSLRKKSFVSSILRLARERESLSIVADQVGNPTFCRDLAQATALVLFAHRRDPFAAIDEARGIYHVAGAEPVSRYDFARAIVELDPKKHEHKVRTIAPVPTTAYPLPAERPLFAPLDCTRFATRFGVTLPAWRASLVRALVGA